MKLPEDLSDEELDVKIAEKLGVEFVPLWAEDIGVLLKLVDQLKPERFDLGLREGKWGCFVVLADRNGVCFMGYSQPTAARAGALAIYLALLSTEEREEALTEIAGRISEEHGYPRSED